MRRFVAAAGCDVVVQARHGFYVVSAVLAPLLGVSLGALPAERLSMQMMLPAVMAFNLLVTTFFFVGALVLLEKAQGSLCALAVCPICPHEYLGAKVTALVFLGLAESLAVVVIAFGVTIVLFLPLLHVFGVVATPLSLLHPAFPSLVLMQGPESFVEVHRWLYGVGGSLVWIAIAFGWARRVYVRATTVQGRPFTRSGA